MKDLKPDIVLRNYWNDNEQFADLFNAVLFDGKPIIQPDDLEDVDMCTVFETIAKESKAEAEHIYPKSTRVS